MNPLLKKIIIAIICIFALIGVIFTTVFVGMRFDLFNVRGENAERNKFFLEGVSASTTAEIAKQPCVDATKKVCEWNKTPEWEVIKNGLQKDKEIISRVASSTGVSSRMIATVVIPEQARFFTANREVFKSYFEPMKILGSMSQFSLGVSGIKEKTALEIEANLADEKSPFYPGVEFAKLIAYSSTTPSSPSNSSGQAKKELYNRLTDEKNHYYSYLYTTLYIKQIETQWKASGFEIAQKPEIMATLFNLGFEKSFPKPNPEVGGTTINLGGKTYQYGTLAGKFYHSEELRNIFP
jgi:hypothetical protein